MYSLDSKRLLAYTEIVLYFVYLTYELFPKNFFHKVTDYIIHLFPEHFSSVNTIWVCRRSILVSLLLKVISKWHLFRLCHLITLKIM